MNLQPSRASSEQLILKSLHHPDFYARLVSSVVRETGLSAEQVVDIAKNHEDMNVFNFNENMFVGLKDRKEAYDRDALEGINPFEASFKGEEFRRAVLGGKPRFPEETL